MLKCQLYNLYNILSGEVLVSISRWWLFFFKFKKLIVGFRLVAESFSFLEKFFILIFIRLRMARMRGPNRYSFYSFIVIQFFSPLTRGGEFCFYMFEKFLNAPNSKFVEMNFSWIERTGRFRCWSWTLHSKMLVLSKAIASAWSCWLSSWCSLVKILVPENPLNMCSVQWDKFLNSSSLPVNYSLKVPDRY
jgi:hypothetical protein